MCLPRRTIPKEKNNILFENTFLLFCYETVICNLYFSMIHNVLILLRGIIPIILNQIQNEKDIPYCLLILKLNIGINLFPFII